MTKSMTFSRVGAMLVLAIYLLLMSALAVNAADIRVEGKCSLRDAIRAANEDREYDTCAEGDGPDTIILTEDTRSGSELRTIRSTVTLEGNNKTLELDEDEPAFSVEDGNLTIKNLIVEYDEKRRNRLFDIEDSRLTIINSTFKNCRAGIEQKNSHITISRDSNLCNLPVDKYVLGEITGTSTVSLPQPPPARTCETLPGNITVMAALGSHSGVQCTDVGAAGVGIQSIVDMGIIDAVDVWAYVEQGVEICFGREGRIIFLDAATSPRSQAQVDSYRLGHQTCAYLQRAGTVVLVQGQTLEDRTPGTTTTPETTTPTTTTTTTTPTTTTTVTTTTTTVTQPVVDGCPITTTGHLKLRATPSLEAEVLGYVLRGTTLGYIERTTFWFRVNHYGQTGWIGWKYVAVIGDCA